MGEENDCDHFFWYDNMCFEKIMLLYAVEITVNMTRFSMIKKGETVNLKINKIFGKIGGY